MSAGIMQAPMPTMRQLEASESPGMFSVTDVGLLVCLLFDGRPPFLAGFTGKPSGNPPSCGGHEHQKQLFQAITYIYIYIHLFLADQTKTTAWIFFFFFWGGGWHERQTFAVVLHAQLHPFYRLRLLRQLRSALGKCRVYEMLEARQRADGFL